MLPMWKNSAGAALSITSTIWIVVRCRELAQTYSREVGAGCASDRISIEIKLVDYTLLALLIPLLGWFMARSDRVADRISKFATIIAFVSWQAVWWLVEWGFEFSRSFEWIFFERPDVFSYWDPLDIAYEFRGIWIVLALAGVFVYLLMPRKGSTEFLEVLAPTCAVMLGWVLLNVVAWVF
jgi:hypothetical protein